MLKLPWNRQEEVKEQHKQMLNDFISNLDPEDKLPDYCEGRGIVSLIGGEKYFPCGYAMIYILRKLGCILPIEAWYIGSHELSPTQRALLESLENVECIDATEKLGDTPRKIGGWEIKVWSIMYSKFSEVLFLDADQVAIKDPTYLFNNDKYKEIGAIFWPDLLTRQGFDITADAFEVAGIPVPISQTRFNPTGYRPFESGQILIDKTRQNQWHTLKVCSHFNNHSDFWYPAPKSRNYWYIYGDKSTFYLAWTRMNTSYLMPRNPDWIGNRIGGSYIQYDLQDNPIFQHRCQPPTKLRINSRNTHPKEFKNVELLEEALKILRGQYVKH